MPTPRPLEHLRDLTTRYPGAWSQLEHFRAARGGELPDWPEHVYVPVAAALAVVSHGFPRRSPEFSRALARANPSDIAAVAALGAWRMTKGVYRFDPDILGALWDTPLTGDLPTDLLHRLPEWCVYVETPGRTVRGAALHGFYAHLESDPGDGRQELRLLLDLASGLLPLPVHLGGSIAAGLEEVEGAAARSAAEYGFDATGFRDLLKSGAGLSGWAEAVAPLVSLVLYLCSERPDIAGDGQPGNPQPKRVKGGPRLFAAPGVRTWDVAYRLGAAFRQARRVASGGGDGPGGRTVGPHWRSAHWHTFLSGPRAGPRTRTLKWLPPVAVGFDPDGDAELPAVVRAVRGGRG